MALHAASGKNLAVNKLRLLKEVKEIPTAGDGEKSVITSCASDCGGSCPLNVHLRNGVISKITSYDDGKVPPLRACIRGLNYHYRVYAPDRLKYPLMRVGERGGGRFKRISWDEALDIVAREMKRIKESYGPEVIFECGYAGCPSMCMLHRTAWGSPTYRLLNSFGGRTTFGTATSDVGASWASRFTYGRNDGADCNSLSDLINSRLIILWGFNPVVNRLGTETLYWLEQAKKKGIKFICVDPRYSETAKYLKAEWVPVRPSTDTAILAAMAFVLIAENLYDRQYIDKYVFGFDRYRDYVLGVADGVPKTPEWAAEITGLPAGAIAGLAREYASAKPAALIQGWAPGRTAHGEQYHRVAIALQAMTGNIGISGGSGSCDGIQLFRSGFDFASTHYMAGSRLSHGGKGVEIKNGKWADAVLRGKAGGYPSDIKMIYVVGHNILTSRQNVNKGVEAFKKVEFVVCQEQFLTPTARYADIVLPVATSFERSDICLPWSKGDYVIFGNRVIEPLWDTKPDFDIAPKLALKLGLADFDNRTEDEWLRSIFETSRIKKYITYEEFKRRGIFRLEEEPIIAFREQIEDPENNPFPTPSGKIEIFSRKLDETNFDVREYSGVVSEYRDIPRIPTFIDCGELPTSPKTGRYPLQLTTPHHRYRIHSQFYNIPKLRNLYKQEVWINSVDARARGIEDGNPVVVFNDRGAIRVFARVTDDVRPGVVSCHEGGWYDPDEKGIDQGGCGNTLTDDMLTSPAGASNFNTCLVEIKKEETI